MKNIIYFLISIFLLMQSGCNKLKTASNNSLAEVEKAIEINPDSARALLDSIIPYSDNLQDKSFAYWCMLSGKISDKIYNALLPAEQFERAYDWYSIHGTPAEQVQILIYCGRSYAADGDYDKAMTIYTDVIDISGRNNLDNFVGYASSYMGDLYEMRAMLEKAINKYKVAAKYFKKAGNIRSYTCALRDIGRGYARIDSVDEALNVLHTADSIAVRIKDKEVKASVDNTLGNLYLIRGDYDRAKRYFSEAVKQGRNKLPNYTALIKLYIQSDSISKAKDLLKKMPENNPQYTYSIRNLSYLIHKSEKNYEAALADLEECGNIVDSILSTKNKSKMINIEARYNNLKIKEQVKDLQIKQKNYIIIVGLCLSSALLIILGYSLYLKNVKGRIQKQEIELSNLKIDFLNLSIELEKKKKLLATIEEKDEEYDQMKEEIANLSNRYKKLQTKLISDSPVYQELLKQVNQNKPGNKKPLITEKQWKLISDEIMAIYPNLYDYLSSLCQNLTEQEVEYCCLCMYGFDTNAEAKLLNISPGSVRTKRLRLRQRLNIILPNQSSLYDYLNEKLN